MQWEALMRDLLRWIYQNRKYRAESEIELNAGPLRLDLFVQEISTSIHEKDGLARIIDKYSGGKAIISIKSPRDNLTYKEVFKILVYLYLTAIKEKWNLREPLELNPIIISSKSPKSFLKALNTSGIKTYILEPGIWKFSYGNNNIILVSINDLEFKPEEFLPLIIFSTGKNLKKTLKYLVVHKDEKDLEKYFNLSLFLYYNEVVKIMNKMEIDTEGIDFPIGQMIEIFGIKKMVDEVGLKKVIDEVGVKKVIDEVGIDEILKVVDLDELIEKLGPDKVIEKLGPERILKIIGKDKIRELLNKEN
ncbi:MAG: hypothetical protein ACTSVC_08650 [Promethearchaeota archaeon]